MFNLLVGKKTLVTGAAQGIGLAVAQLFAQNGADVVLADLNGTKAAVEAEKLTAATGRDCIGILVDVALPESVEALFTQAMERFGRLDAVCHAAGILVHASLLEMSPDAWDRVFAVNVRGTFLVTQAAGRVMKPFGYGKIIHLSSCSGKKPTQDEGAYCASKSAVNGLVKVAALEFGPMGIRVNAICPGATDTEMVRKNFLTSPEIEREWIEKTALKRLGQPEDQARVALFLASILSDHVTGETLVVSAGEMMTQ